MSGLKTRAITAVIFVAIMIAGIYSHSYSLTLLFFVILVGCLWELFNLSFKTQESKHKTFQLSYAIKIGVVPFVLMAIHLLGYPFSVSLLKIILGGYLLFILGFMIFELSASAKDPFRNVGLAMLGIIYLGIPFALLIDMAIGEGFRPNLVLGLLLLVWANDAFAYLIGSQIGKTKLFERISPKKTWEGSIGGFISTMIVAVLVYFVMGELTMIQWVVLGGMTTIFATTGDLIESMWKRSLGIKDSGSFMPGHGGFLDRFDAVIFTLPFSWFLLEIWPS